MNFRVDRDDTNHRIHRFLVNGPTKSVFGPVFSVNGPCLCNIGLIGSRGPGKSTLKSRKLDDLGKKNLDRVKRRA